MFPAAFLQRSLRFDRLESGQAHSFPVLNTSLDNVGLFLLSHAQRVKSCPCYWSPLVFPPSGNSWNMWKKWDGRAQTDNYCILICSHSSRRSHQLQGWKIKSPEQKGGCRCSQPLCPKQTVRFYFTGANRWTLRAPDETLKLGRSDSSSDVLRKCLFVVIRLCLC